MADDEGPNEDPNENPPDFPVPNVPINTMLDASDVMKGAERKSYLGTLTDTDAKSTVNRNFQLDYRTDLIVHEVSNDRRFGYDSIAHVLRHATAMLMDYYAETDLFKDEYQGFATETLRKLHELRLDAERGKMRLAFADDVKVGDKETHIAMQCGDWEFIGNRLKKYTALLETCESESQRREIRGVLAQSVALKSATIAFYRYLNTEFRTPTTNWDDNWPELVERWYDMYAEEV